ncbi:unnamed protein product [Cochlearia groenlandica]
MASFTIIKSILCFLVAFFCFIDNNVEAREGKLFFSKFTHLDHPNNKEVAITPSPAPGLAEANGRLGDGPFGPGSGMIPQTKESWPVSSTTTDDEEFEKLMATFDEDKNNKLPNEFDEETEESEDLNEQKDKYNNNNNNEYTYTTRRGYGNDEERQGMSDTRFMENGKFFYDTRGRNDQNTPIRGYVSPRGNVYDPNEFETMEEYYKSLEGSQEEYEP